MDYHEYHHGRNIGIIERLASDHVEPIPLQSTSKYNKWQTNSANDPKLLYDIRALELPASTPKYNKGQSNLAAQSQTPVQLENARKTNHRQESPQPS